MASRAQDFHLAGFLCGPAKCNSGCFFVWARYPLAPNQIVRTGTKSIPRQLFTKPREHSDPERLLIRVCVFGSPKIKDG
jgi:hypothetical protein